MKTKSKPKARTRAKRPKAPPLPRIFHVRVFVPYDTDHATLESGRSFMAEGTVSVIAADDYEVMAKLTAKIKRAFPNATELFVRQHLNVGSVRWSHGRIEQRRP